MSNPLRTSDDYELFIYTLAEQFPSIRRSTVTFVRLGATLARASGELHFDHDIRLVIRERVLYHRLPAVIDWYGYEVWQGENKLYWYDSQPHPDDPVLEFAAAPQACSSEHQTQPCSRARDEFQPAKPAGAHSGNRGFDRERMTLHSCNTRCS